MQNVCNVLKKNIYTLAKMAVVQNNNNSSLVINEFRFFERLYNS